MTSGGDEVEEGVHPVVPETGVTFDTGLLSENVIVLALQVADNLLEAVAGRVVERGRVDEDLNTPTQIRCRCCRQIRECRQW